MTRVLAPPRPGSQTAQAAGHAEVRRDAPAIYGGLLVTALIAMQWALGLLLAGLKVVVVH